MALFGNLNQPYAPIQAPSLDSLMSTQGTGNPAITAPMQAPKKPGAFAQGGKGWQILGIIGDALQTAGGGRGTYIPAMLDLQQQTAQERHWQEQLAAQAAAKVAEANQPTAEMRNFQFFQQLDPAARQLWAEKNRGDPIVNMTLGDRFISAPSSQIGSLLQSSGGKPAAALDATPTVEDGHAYTPGPGGRANPANWKAVGGGVGNGTGGFR